MSDSYIKQRTLQYAARYTQIAESLFATGRIALHELSELVRCGIMVALAVKLGEMPIDTIPFDYQERVKAALSRVPLEGKREAATTWN